MSRSSSSASSPTPVGLELESIGGHGKPYIISHYQLTTKSILSLTCPYFGAQIVWVIQQAFGAPFLLTLGFSNSELSAVLLAGPLAGLIVPPVIGAISDGNRYPYILCGALGVLLSLPCLAWADNIGDAMAHLTPDVLWHDDGGPGPSSLLVKLTAAVAAYVLNVSMQPLHINLRALLMDCCPPNQQTVASLWITRFSAFGSVFGTSIAYFASPSFKLLAVSSCGVLGAALTLHGIEFRRQKTVQGIKVPPNKIMPSIPALTRFKLLARMAFRLPPATQRVCRTQMFAWFAWFAMLYYTSSLVSAAYLFNAAGNGHHYNIAEESDVASAGVALVFHVAALLMTLILQGLCGEHTPSCVNDTHGQSEMETHTSSKTDENELESTQTQLFRIWSLALCISAAAMFATWLVGEVGNIGGLILGLMGALFSVANWIPYALISIDVSILQNDSKERIQEENSCQKEPTLDHATAILAIHNIAICIPQILSSGATALFFATMKNLELKADVSWVFLLIAPSLLLAAWDRESWGRTKKITGNIFTVNSA